MVTAIGENYRYFAEKEAIDMEKDVLEKGIWHNSDLDKNAAYKDDRIAIIDNIQGLKDGQNCLNDLVKVDAVLLAFV